ncbi:MAG: NfeD family protein [Oscillatoria sp. PMC 1068.18]|nr:NfeD family protein [Oscillatoria sp. PMC 1076.18]MEC4991090.1 NfeD family protein [Oscillatoria sp. PMC 1068.18]
MRNFLKSFLFPLPAKTPNIGEFPLEDETIISYRNCQGKAVVDEEIRPEQKGRVRFRGSWWPALCEQEIIISSGEVVKVVGRCNITLLVEPLTMQQAQEP